MTFLPLHAAGHHPTTPYVTTQDTVMDRVISSYTPTIRALAHAHTHGSHPADSATSARPVLIVAVPDAPHTEPLHGVARESRDLRQLVPAATLLPAPGSTTTRDSVTTALLNYPIAHFACHGIADWAHPADSRLVLHDHADHPLTVDRIGRLRLTHADLAYLSACSTTDTNPRHADEATHLTAAFHLAGYRAVIGTLWPINDVVATAIARDFYGYLTNNGTAPPDPVGAAQALHHALRRYRTRNPTQPTHWAAHTHTGK
jgi:CHAT domain-containing protein